MKVHDYTSLRWGHNCYLEPISEGKFSATGSGADIRPYDLLVLFDQDKRPVAYYVDTVSYYKDPLNLWYAQLTYLCTTDGRDFPTMQDLGIWALQYHKQHNPQFIQKFSENTSPSNWEIPQITTPMIKMGIVLLAAAALGISLQIFTNKKEK